MLNYHITIISSDELPKSSATRYYRYIVKTEDRDVCKVPFKMSLWEKLCPLIQAIWKFSLLMCCYIECSTEKEIYLPSIFSESSLKVQN